MLQKNNFDAPLTIPEYSAVNLHHSNTCNNILILITTSKINHYFSYLNNGIYDSIHRADFVENIKSQNILKKTPSSMLDLRLTEVK